MSKQHTVMAVLKAKPGKESELEAQLQTVAKSSRLEDANLEYRLHKNVNKPQEFILYEHWTSKEKHEEQFTKSYIKEFAEKLEDLLAKPYEVYMAEEI